MSVRWKIVAISYNVTLAYFSRMSFIFSFAFLFSVLRVFEITCVFILKEQEGENFKKEKKRVNFVFDVLGMEGRFQNKFQNGMLSLFLSFFLFSLNRKQNQKAIANAIIFHIFLPHVILIFMLGICNVFL